MTAPDNPEMDKGCICQRCGREYRVDIMVSNEIWDKIRPDSTRHIAAGLLCGPCIALAIENLYHENEAFGVLCLEVIL